MEKPDHAQHNPTTMLHNASQRSILGKKRKLNDLELSSTGSLASSHAKENHQLDNKLDLKQNANQEQNRNL